MGTVRSAARARNQAHPRLALLVWLLALVLLALTGRLAAAEPARSTDAVADHEDRDDVPTSGHDVGETKPIALTKPVVVHTETEAVAESGTDAGAESDAIAESVTDADADTATDTEADTDPDADRDDRDDRDDRGDDNDISTNRRRDADDLSWATDDVDLSTLADDDEPIDAQTFLVDDNETTNAPSVIATEQREALRRRQSTRFGRVDLSLAWRRVTTERDDILAARNELWLVATWRL